MNLFRAPRSHCNVDSAKRGLFVIWSRLVLIALMSVSSPASVTGLTLQEHATPVWRVSERPILVIKDDGSLATQFSTIVGAIRLSDGRILVADSRAREVRLFSPSGKFVSTVTRAGSGPAEVRDIRALQQVGRRFFSIGLQDVVELPVAGKSKSPISTQRTTLPPSGLMVGLIGEDQALSAETRLRVLVGPSRIIRDTTSLVLRDIKDAKASHQILRTLGQSSLVLEDLQSSSPLKFGKMILDAQFLYAISDSMLWFGDSGVDSLSRFSAKDKRVKTFAIHVTRQKWDELALRSWQSSEKSRSKNGAELALIDAMFSTKWRPVHPPLFKSMVSDLGGGLWIELFSQRINDQPRFLVLNKDGSLVGSVSLPLGSRLLSTSERHVVVSLLDEDDVPSVAVYSLDRKFR